MNEDVWQRLVMGIAATVRDAVEGVYRERLDAAFVDLCVLADLIESSNDPDLIAAARDVVARHQPSKRAWHDCPPAGHA